MAEIGNLFVKIGSKLDRKGFDKARQALNNVAMAGAAMGAALSFAAIKAAKAAGIQEQAELMLAQAMKQAGTFTELAHKHNLEYASSLQKMTTYGDEAILGVQRMLTNFGAEGEMLDKLTKSTLDLAAAKGMTLASAGDLVAKSIGSTTNALTRYGIKVEGAEKSTERMQMAVDNITALFGGAAQAKADTYAGRVEQLSNRWGDFIEKIGFKVIPFIEQLMDLIEKRVLPAMENWLDNTGEMKRAISFFGDTLSWLIKIVTGLVAAFDILGTAISVYVVDKFKYVSATMHILKGDFAGAKEAFNEFAEAGKIGADELSIKITEYGETFRALSEEEVAITQEKELKKSEIRLKVKAKIDKEKKEAGKIKIKEDKKEIVDYQNQINLSVKMHQEKAKEIKRQADDMADTMMSGIRAVANVEKVTWKSGGEAFKESIKSRLAMWVEGGIQEIIANKFKSLAIAIMNSTVTWGSAAYQIGGVLAASAAGIAGLRGIASMDEGGIVPGPVGQPVLIQALGGEKFLGKKSIGTGGNTVINVSGNYILDDAMADSLAEKIGAVLYRDVQEQRAV